MTAPYGENAYIYALHDTGGEQLMFTNGKAKGWLVITEKIGSNPNDHGGRNYKSLADKGFGIIVRLNNAYADEDGTIPHSSKYLHFAQRAANFVQASKGAHIWIIGNEINMRREQPPNEIITPRRYADCYRQVREAIKKVHGHKNDQVLTSPIGPWNGETWYEADPLGAYPANKISGAPHVPPYNGFFGDYNRFLRDMLTAIGPENCDGIALHTYSHGYDPDLIFSDQKMGNPFQRYHFQFRAYRDQMHAIPWAFRHLPAYITETNGDQNPDGSRWPNENSGWVKNAYREINNWNKAGNQQIRCAALYRWSTDDAWTIKPKNNVQDDLKDAVKFNFKYDPDFVPQKPPAPEINVQDITATLPTNSTLAPYPTRARSDISRFVLNHTATPPTVTPQRIAEYQSNNDAHPRPGIAYHFCVTDAGEIFQTQALETVSDHAGQFSGDSIGICLIGNFTDAPPPDAQLEATATLIANLSVDLSIEVNNSTIVGYRELAITASPGDTWDAWKLPLVTMAQSMTSGDSVPATTPPYRAEFLSHNTPSTFKTSQTVSVQITLQNTGKFTWVRGGANPFHLGFKWFDQSGQEIAFPSHFDFRTILPADVPPQQVITLQAQLRTPDKAGIYRLRWDMVHEQVTWFADQGQIGLEIEGISVSGGTSPTQPILSPTQTSIQNISDSLPKNPNLPSYPTRSLSQIRQFVLNHTATPPTVTPQRIAEYQTQNETRPRPGIAYHYCVTNTGEVFQTQPLRVVSNHAGQFSTESVGICLIGNFTDSPPPAAQLGATAALIAKVATQLNLSANAGTILGYSDLAVTASPGDTWAQWRGTLVSQAQAIQSGTTVVQPPVDGGTHPVPTGKVIRHYLLLWHHGGDNWAEWDLVSAVDYIGAFKPTVGFSVDEAKLAEYVTIVGGTGGVSSSAEQSLRAAGCKVERLNGATQEETNQMLYDLVASGRAFRTF